jgi:hypothetical protein
VVIVTGMKENVLSLSDYSFQRTRARLDGRTDDDYVWGPVPDCWLSRSSSAPPSVREERLPMLPVVSVPGASS